ncbi:hypothetical protein LZ198_32910 [Myxococcus sp. K15C18031901]|uniref:DUF6843 domain-containing protein n=1 Tax=Myxococcus dinghuensis TaxID=2906761 RepID=UPI0020A75D5B|nr:hypothetical protein [Myxococcus dinghuensis]MCP3103694.1 hypothetical protein [Myxococcus dinghuensis]
MLGLSLVVLGACSSRAAPEVHLLPAGYVGPVVILFDVPEGQPVDARDRTYRIGPDGLLAVSAPENPGWQTEKELRFYYVNPDGSRERIPMGRERPEDSLQVFGRHVRTTFRETTTGGVSTRHVIKAHVYAVGVPSRMDDWLEEGHARMERWADVRYGPRASAPVPDAMTP